MARIGANDFVSSLVFVFLFILCALTESKPRHELPRLQLPAQAAGVVQYGPGILEVLEQHC